MMQLPRFKHKLKSNFVISFQFEAIGTHWNVEIYKELSKDIESSLLNKMKDRIEIFDKDYSRFRSDSLVTKMSKNSGKYKMPDDFEKMISIYKKAYNVTDGHVTPLIGNTLVQSGYDAEYSLKKGNMTSPKEWEKVIEWNKPALNVLEPVTLDFGACGKGYLVDIVSEIIEKEGINDYLVDASGDMRYRSASEESIIVGLEHPDDSGLVIGKVSLKNKSLCGSSGNRRKWEDLHHIINPKTLTSPKDILSVWTIAQTTIEADILTTCLFFTSVELLSKHFNFEYLVLFSDYTVKKSSNFNTEIFTG